MTKFLISILIICAFVVLANSLKYSYVFRLRFASYGFEDHKGNMKLTYTTFADNLTWVHRWNT